MKKLLSLLTILLFAVNIIAQSPQKMSYQAVVRNNSNALIINHLIGMKISILQTSSSGTVVYAETQTPTTNANGLLNVAIGTGSVISGVFSTIDWSAVPYFIKTEIDPAGGTAYNITSTSELLSVPYALYAKESAKAKLITLPYYGEITHDSPAFQVYNSKGSAIVGNSTYSENQSYGSGVSGEGYVGVMGINMFTTGYGIGVWGMVRSPSGVAVLGESNSKTGTTYSIKGWNTSSSGIGVMGYCDAYSGDTRGVVGTINSPDGFSGHFSGGKFYVKGKVGVGTETPGAGIHLKGTGYPDSFMFIESATGNDAGFRIYEGATAKWHIFNDVNAGGLRMYNTGAVTAIFCKQSNSFVGINTLTPAYNLDVNGTAGKTGGGSWSTSSDIRLKDVTGNYTKGLKEVVALQPVSFVYKTGNARHLPTDVHQIGFVAQEVQKVFPEAVTKGEDGYLDFNIHAINVALVNAIKELKAENEQLKSENKQLKLISEKNDIRLTEIENTLRNNIEK